MNDFFEEQSDQSLIKARIVVKYFDAWSKVIKNKTRTDRIAYIDLYCGPGRYKDGSPSTPLLILETAIADKKLQRMLVTIFNDESEETCDTLEKEISKLPGIHTLKYKPQVICNEVGTELQKVFEGISLVPSLVFIDPFGYAGLTLNLVSSFLKDWGCDCIFFFNYNRINAGISNEYVEHHMKEIFGDNRFELLLTKTSGLSPLERELLIINEVGEALKEIGGEYVIPFRFRNGTGNRTSHYLFFVSKNVLGYSIMKDIMAKESSEIVDGVGNFEYTPVTNKQLTLLYEYSRPIDELIDQLKKQFSGKTLTMEQIYYQHHVGTKFVKKNYKNALKLLEEEGAIRCVPPADQRKKGTLRDDVIVTFPS